jgi:hypothetical protein
VTPAFDLGTPASAGRAAVIGQLLRDTDSLEANEWTVGRELLATARDRLLEPVHGELDRLAASIAATGQWSNPVRDDLTGSQGFTVLDVPAPTLPVPEHPVIPDGPPGAVQQQEAARLSAKDLGAMFVVP